MSSNSTTNGGGNEKRGHIDHSISNNKRQPYVDRYAQSMSMDSGDGGGGAYGQKDNYYRKFGPPGGGPPPPPPHHDSLQQHGHHHHLPLPPPHIPYPHQYHHLPPHSRLVPGRNLHSVITTSFSIDEERDHGSSGLYGRSSKYRESPKEQRMETEEYRQDADDRDDWGSPRSGRYVYYPPGVALPPYPRPPLRVNGSSPRSRENEMQMQMMPLPNKQEQQQQQVQEDRRPHPYVQRSYSSSGYFVPPAAVENLKRSYFHHSRPTIATSTSTTSALYPPGQLPPDFLPPKRSKVDPPPRRNTTTKSSERIVSPGSGGSGGVGSEFREKPSTSREWAIVEGGPYGYRSNSFPIPPPPPLAWGGGKGGYGPPHPHPPPSSSTTSSKHLYPYVQQISPASEAGVVDSPRGSWHHHQPQSPHWSGPSMDLLTPLPTTTNRFWASSSPRVGTTHPDMEQREREREQHHAWGPPPRESIGSRPDDETKHRVPNMYGVHNKSSVSSTGGSAKVYLEPKSKTTKSSGGGGVTENSNLNVRDKQHESETGGGSVPTSPPRHQNNHLDEASMLLALPNDRVALSETLCVVRENIEVFTATLDDVNAPAPGRKHAVVVDQVGLRCIHCRHTTRSCDRVKRAVCYPSSIKRIYRTVIDMKLDHFSQCKYVPESLRKKLDELKAIHTRSTGTTMSYFCNAARMLGMEDADNGVVLREFNNNNNKLVVVAGKSSSISQGKSKTIPTTPMLIGIKKEKQGMEEEENETRNQRSSDQQGVTGMASTSSPHSWENHSKLNTIPPRSESMSMGSEGSSPRSESPTVSSPVTLDRSYEGLIPLALMEDKTALSPLRCFLREQVCAFSATENDIAVRAPTTFSICVGQVGIGCIHCVRQSATLRSNRAVCFPFSIGRIYQSVADIQRFHFGECKNMPENVKETFLKLQSASSKGSKGLATRQYWMTSAKKIGLVDTLQGIRFGRDPSKPESSKSFSLDILAQVAFSVTTSSKQLVLPEDKPCIAEFLYVVMEQLQPCRFTEADRNKRRLKDVGCIGVECKHCAGQVDSRKFFWSSVSAVESNFVSVHTHMLECRMIPAPLKDRLHELKKLRKEQTSALKTGSQKAFFARVWNRLHDDEESSSSSSDNDDRPEASHENGSNGRRTKPDMENKFIPSPPPPPLPTSAASFTTTNKEKKKSSDKNNVKDMEWTTVAAPALTNSTSLNDESEKDNSIFNLEKPTTMTSTTTIPTTDFIGENLSNFATKCTLAVENNSTTDASSPPTTTFAPSTNVATDNVTDKEKIDGTDETIKVGGGKLNHDDIPTTTEMVSV